VRKGAAAPAVTLRKSGERWTVAERADYPADTSKLRKLLQSLRDAKIVEEKTSDPALFAGIGVEDPAAAGATGAEVTAIAPSGRIGVMRRKTAGEFFRCALDENLPSSRRAGRSARSARGRDRGDLGPGGARGGRVLDPDAGEQRRIRGFSSTILASRSDCRSLRSLDVSAG